MKLFKEIFKRTIGVFKSWKKVSLLLICILFIGEQTYLIVTSIQQAKVIKKMTKDIDNLESDVYSLESELDNTSSDLDSKASHINSLQSEIEDKENRIEDLENQINY